MVFLSAVSFVVETVTPSVKIKTSSLFLLSKLYARVSNLGYPKRKTSSVESLTLKSRERDRLGAKQEGKEQEKSECGICQLQSIIFRGKANFI